MSYEVSFEHITKSFGSQAVLRDISFHVPPGQVHAVLGRNGAGKSTLFSIFLGLLPADSGTVRVAGKPWSRGVLDRVGASVNGPAFYGHLSATDNLRVHTRLLGLPDSEINRVLDIAGLAGAGSKKAKSFSTGMKARLALAQALLGDPEILLLDEPQNGLDPQGIAELRRLLQHLAAAGHTIVVSSHQLGEVLHLAHDITILSQGIIRYSGSLQELAPVVNWRPNSSASLLWMVRPMCKQYRRYLSAELLRCRGSAVQWLPLLALPLVILTVFFSAFASSAEDATGVLGWQSMFITGMYAPLIALFAGVPERREALSRGGGTLWRRLNPRYEHASRFLIVLASLAVFHLLNFGLSWAAVAAQGRAEHEVLIIAGAYSFLGAIGIAGFATAGARRLGLAVTLILAVIWQVISLIPGIVEGSLWWVFPPAWPLRLLLPALRIHQNSVPLEPGDPLLQESPFPALALCLVLALAGAFTATMTPHRLQPLFGRRRFSAPTANTPATPSQGWQPAIVSRAAARSRLAGALRGFRRAVMTPAVITCSALSALALIFVALDYPPSYVQGFFVLLLLPVGAGVLPVLVWPGFADAWPIVYTESRHCSTALLLWLLGIVAMVCTCASAAVFLAGDASLGMLAQLPLAIGVGYVLTVLSLIVVIRFGIFSSLALTIIGTIVSLAVGGDVLAKTVLWLVAFPAWPMNADSPGRYAGAALITLLFAVISSWAARSLLRTRALRPST